MEYLYYLYRELEAIEEHLKKAGIDKSVLARIDAEDPDMTLRDVSKEIHKEISKLKKELEHEYGSEDIPAIITIDDVIEETEGFINSYDLASFLLQNPDIDIHDIPEGYDICNQKNLQTRRFSWDFSLSREADVESIPYVPADFIDWYNPHGVEFTKNAGLPEDYFWEISHDWNRVYSVTIDPSVKGLKDILTQIPWASQEQEGDVIVFSNREKAKHYNQEYFYNCYLDHLEHNEEVSLQERKDLATKFAELALASKKSEPEYLSEIEDTDFKGAVKIYEDWARTINPHQVPVTKPYNEKHKQFLSYYNEYAEAIKEITGQKNLDYYQNNLAQSFASLSFLTGESPAKYVAEIKKGDYKNACKLCDAWETEYANKDKKSQDIER